MALARALILRALALAAISIAFAQALHAAEPWPGANALDQVLTGFADEATRQNRPSPHAFLRR